MKARGYPDAEFTENCCKQIEGFGSMDFRKATPRFANSRWHASAWSQMPLPRCVRRSASSTASRWASTRLRNSCAMRRSTAWRCGRRTSIIPTGIAPWRAVPEGTLHARHASMADDPPNPTRPSPGLSADRCVFRRMGATIERVRRHEGFDSVRDLWLRSGLPPKALERLAHADAFRSLGLSRRDALWAVKARAAARRQGRPAAVRACGDA